MSSNNTTQNKPQDTLKSQDTSKSSDNQKNEHANSDSKKDDAATQKRKEMGADETTATSAENKGTAKPNAEANKQDGNKESSDSKAKSSAA